MEIKLAFLFCLLQSHGVFVFAFFISPLQDWNTTRLKELEGSGKGIQSL